MTSNLHRLVYYSRNSMTAAPPEVAGEVESILAVSRQNNPKAGVTGALIFNSGIFAQILEGTRRDIEETFERIQRDERHEDVQVLAFEAVESRTFPSWSMAFVGRSRQGQELFGSIGEATGFEDKRLDGERIFSIIRDIAMEEERQAAA